MTKDCVFNVFFKRTSNNPTHKWASEMNSWPSKGEVQMANKYMRMWSTHQPSEKRKTRPQ